MKKILSVLAILSFLAVLALPVLAQEPLEECCTLKRAVTFGPDSCAAGQVAAPSAAADTCNGDWCNASANKWGMFCLVNTLYSITDWIYVVLVAIAGLFVIVGAMTLLMAAGAPEKITSGRNYILYAAVGLLVGLLARAVPSLVMMIAGM